MWKFCPQEDFYTELKQVKIHIENDGKVKVKWFVAYVSQQECVVVKGVTIRAKAGLFFDPRERGK